MTVKVTDEYEFYSTTGYFYKTCKNEIFEIIDLSYQTQDVSMKLILPNGDTCNFMFRGNYNTLQEALDDDQIFEIFETYLDCDNEYLINLILELINKVYVS